MESPKLRNISKVGAPFPLNDFPKSLPFILGKEIIYLLATKTVPAIEGAEWERIFAHCISAEWKPSNVGLDDIVLGNTAWGAKSIKAKTPSVVNKVRLISGRNSPVYSFGTSVSTKADPNMLGKMVLDIWNARVTSVREKYENLRTVVLIKSEDLCELALFEFDTIRYDPELFHWEFNSKGNLIGTDPKNNQHLFTWQPHGSQFTILEEVPNKMTVIRIRKPEMLDKAELLKTIGFDNEWIKIEEKSRNTNM